MKLNLGAGNTVIEGFGPRDCKRGDSLYPLPDAADSADEIRASHVLEHFSHRKALEVLREWVRVLKPGGLIRLAVPDLEYIAQGYLAGRAEPWTAYLCGGHVDQDDVHLAQYDEPSLGALMRGAGLVGVHRWKGDAGDCSTLPVSLNLAAWKPPAAWPSVYAVMSVPRLGFMDNFFSMVDLLASFKIPVRKTQGAFWGQCLTRSIEEALAGGAQYVLTLDYDSVFGAEAVADLLATAIAHPEIDALVPLEMSRISGVPLMTVPGADGKPLREIDRAALDATLMPITTGHFGCTLLKLDAVKRMRKPWFLGVPDAHGRWGDGRTDEDIHFWRQWHASGNTVACAPRCVIGHAELYVIWPDRNLQNILQHSSDYWRDGQPMGVWR